MKKIILLLVLTFGLFQVTNAQCTFTHTVSGNTATFTPVPFIVIGTTVIDSLVYDYGDGNTANIPLSQPNNSHTYATGGTYNVCHTYFMHQLGNPSNTFTCVYCDSVTIGNTQSNCFVTAGFTSSPGVGFTVNFTNTSSCATCVTGSSVWDYGDGNTSTLPQGPHTYMMPGTYNVCLYQVGVNALNITCIDTFCSTITVSQSSGCNTSISTTSTNSSITAVGSATGGAPPYTYSYNLNPGNITNSTGSFTGLQPGLYTVCVTATDTLNNICSSACDSVTVGNSLPCTTTIQVNGAPNSASAFATASGGVAPYTYVYTLNPGNITNTTGNFGGPLTPGVYTVCAYAIDANADTCSFACDTAIVGSFFPCSTTIQSSVNGNTITSVATASGGTAPYTYSYNLNPGNITNSTGVFSGLANGGYSICVTAIDANQNTCSIACDSVLINNTSNCATFIQSSVSGNTITASATATGGIAPYTYTYTLNGGSPNTTGNYPGLAPGIYVVCATAFDAMQNICSTDCDSLVVSNTIPGGGCIINANFTEVISGLTVNFTNTTTISNGTISTYGWSFGDGNVSTAPSPVHSYLSASTYNVVLVVNGYDSLQVPCVDSFSKSITVMIPFGVNDVKKQDLTIYPNPTSKNITIEIPNNEKVENVVITDISGRIIETNYEEIDVNKLKIGFKNQSDGIYFIKLLTDKHIYTSSILKQE